MELYFPYGILNTSCICPQTRKHNISPFVKFQTTFTLFFFCLCQAYLNSFILCIYPSADHCQLVCAQFGSAHNVNPACKHDNFTKLRPVNSIAEGVTHHSALPQCPSHTVSSPWLRGSSTTVPFWKRFLPGPCSRSLPLLFHPNISPH